MASVESTELFGQFMHPLIDPDTSNDDPWLRNYYQPPQLKRLVPRTFPLIDVRPIISDPKYVPTGLLKTHGFGVVKHSSAFLHHSWEQGNLAEQQLVEKYHPEIQDLVRKTTGARHVIILATVLRRGLRAPESYTLPPGLRPVPATRDGSRDKEQEAEPAEKPQGSKPMALAKPVRVPHMDFTPLGARQTIRSQGLDIYNTAVQSGVIAAEDKICENHPFPAQSREADPFVAEQYNQNGTLGPRYAAYSVWRPLKKVGRDPLALAPAGRSAATAGDLVYWPYENKIPGPAELGGDFLKEYAMLGVQGEQSPVDSSNISNPLQWYYLSAQEPDEVLIIKLFDSAALGKDAQDAGAPWHASPEIGVEDGSPRESIELRTLAFW